MSRLEDMQIDVETVERAGFSAAAQRLGLSKQYVSVRVAALKARLGARLLIRTTRKLSPTALGTEYGERARRVLAEVDEADRAGMLPDSSLAARRLAPARQLTVAAPDYLERHGAPETPAALLLYGHARPVSWHDRVDGVTRAAAVDGRLRANNGELLMDAALQGLGITQLPDFLVGGAVRGGRLRTVLDDAEPEPGAAHVVYPSHRQPSAGVKALADVLCLALGSDAAG